MDNMERLAQKAHHAWPNRLTSAEVLSLLAGWQKPGGPQRAIMTANERAWLVGLRSANETIYREVVALKPPEESNPS